MPKLLSPRQPAFPASWFHGQSGSAVLTSEAAVVAHALETRPGQVWLWLTPVPPPQSMDGGICLSPTPGHAHSHERWTGGMQCGWPLPIASESMATVVAQHVGDRGGDRAAMIEECSRVLMPGGWLWLFALNPLTPYRRHWRGTGLGAIEPFAWRRHMRRAGLEPTPVSSGLGPRWRIAHAPNRQHGAGLRAAYLLQAQKRRVAPIPPSPVRALRWQQGMPAT